MTASAPLRSTVPPRASAGGVTLEGDYLVLGKAASGESRSTVLSRDARKALPGPTGGMAVLEPEEPSPAPPFSRRGGWGFWSGGLLLVAAFFWVSGGHAWLLPDAKASPTQAGSGLSLAFVGSRTETMDGKPVLLVEAQARNGEARVRALPPLAILITTGKGARMQYRVAAPREGVGPGGRQLFSTRLPVPADGVRAVGVAFAR